MVRFQNKPSKWNLNKKAFSRVEMIAVIALVVLMLNILTPVIVLVREAARQRRCANNLRQLGAALLQYHNVHTTFPPAAFWTDRDQDISRIYESPTSSSVTHANWVVLLLPHLGQAALADQFNQQAPVADSSNTMPRNVPLSFMTCPSDSYNNPRNSYFLQASTSNSGKSHESTFARGNYAINGGSHRETPFPGNTASPCPNGFHFEFDERTRQFCWYGSGIAGINKSFASTDFTNGTSTLVAIDEVRAGVVPIDSRGVWSLGQIGGSITWAHGVNGDAYGPNNVWTRSDDIVGCSDVTQVVGEETLRSIGMPCFNGRSFNAQATARSMHAGGVHVLMLDGSVRFIVDKIDPSIWHVMHSRETPPEMLGDDFGKRLSATEPQVAGAEWLATVPDYPVPAISPGVSDPTQFETITNSIGYKLIKLPAGEFIMGLPDIGNTEELPANVPAHRVRLTNAFYFGAYEVTESDFEVVMKHAPNPGNISAKPQKHTSTGSRLPVVNVSWTDAAEFCKALSSLPVERTAGRHYRLPTEAEWEYACRAGRTSPYHFNWIINDGDNSGETAGKNNRIEDRGRRSPLPISAVGSYPPNDWGLYDMRGNVFEWCNDWFARDYYSRSPINDPQGPATGYLRVVRGSDWLFVTDHCKINRVVNEPFRKSDYIGFRVACDLAVTE